MRYRLTVVLDNYSMSDCAFHYSSVIANEEAQFLCAYVAGKRSLPDLRNAASSVAALLNMPKGEQQGKRKLYRIFHRDLQHEFRESDAKR